MVVPATLVGRPESMALVRPMFWPCAPWGWPQPRTTSSISAGSSLGVLARTSLMQWATKSSGRVRLKEPRKDLASGVLVLATTTASLILGSRAVVKFFYDQAVGRTEVRRLHTAAINFRSCRDGAQRAAPLQSQRCPPRKAAPTTAKRRQAAALQNASGQRLLVCQSRR